MNRFDLIVLLSIFAFLFLLFLSLDAVAQTKTSTVKVDLNTADVATLATLPGIGQKRARAIVKRRARRPFRRVRDLLRIRGIGKKRLRALRARVWVSRTGVSRSKRPDSRSHPDPKSSSAR